MWVLAAVSDIYQWQNNLKDHHNGRESFSPKQLLVAASV